MEEGAKLRRDPKSRLLKPLSRRRQGESVEPETGDKARGQQDGRSAGGGRANPDADRAAAEGGGVGQPLQTEPLLSQGTEGHGSQTGLKVQRQRTQQ